MDSFAAGLIYTLTSQKLPNSFCNIPCANYPGEYCGGTYIDTSLGVVTIQTYYQNVYVLRNITATPTSAIPSIPSSTNSPYCLLGCYSDGDSFFGLGLTDFAPLFPGLAANVTIGSSVSTQVNVAACLNSCSINAQLSTFVGIEFNPLLNPSCYCSSQIKTTDNYHLVPDSYCNYTCPDGSPGCGGFEGSPGNATQYYVKLYGICNTTSSGRSQSSYELFYMLTTQYHLLVLARAIRAPFLRAPSLQG